MSVDNRINLDDIELESLEMLANLNVSPKEEPNLWTYNQDMINPKLCTCGTESALGVVPTETHASYCDLKSLPKVINDGAD